MRGRGYRTDWLRAVNTEYVNGLDCILGSLKRQDPHPSPCASLEMARLYRSHAVFGYIDHGQSKEQNYTNTVHRNINPQFRNTKDASPVTLYFIDN